MEFLLTQNSERHASGLNRSQNLEFPASFSPRAFRIEGIEQTEEIEVLTCVTPGEPISNDVQIMDSLIRILRIPVGGWRLIACWMLQRAIPGRPQRSSKIVTIEDYINPKEFAKVQVTTKEQFCANTLFSHEANVCTNPIS